MKKTQATTTPRLWSFIFAFAAVMFIIAGIANIHLSDKQNKTFANGIGVTGTVTKIHTIPSATRGRGSSYKVDYTYTTTKQQTETGSGYLDGPILNGLKPGSTVTVEYNPDKPDQSILAANMPSSNNMYGLVFFGLVLAAISGGLFIASKR